MRILVLVVAMHLAGDIVFAQGGSLLSHFGIGDVRASTGAAYDGLAGCHIAVPMEQSVNVMNPSMLGMYPLTRVQAGFRFSQHLNQQGGRSVANVSSALDGLLFLFSIDTSYGLGLAAGYIPYSTVSYETTVPVSTVIDNAMVSGISKRSGTGGTSAAVIALSFRPLSKLYIGISTMALFGAAEHGDILTLSGDGYFGLTTAATHSLRGYLGRLGIYYKVTNKINVGAVVTSGASGTLKTSHFMRAVRGSSVAYDSASTFSSEFDMPFGFGLGASVQDGKWLYCADAELNDLSSIRVRAGDPSLSTRMRLAVGAHRSGTRSAGASGFETVGLATGLGYTNEYYTVDGKPVNNYFASGGISFFVGSSAVVDISLQSGVRMAGAVNSLTELYGRLGATVSIGDQWFRPIRREY